MVGEEGLGRGAAESVHGGVDPVGALCGLGELLEEEECVRQNVLLQHCHDPVEYLRSPGGRLVRSRAGYGSI